jgi:hypothetical protein
MQVASADPAVEGARPHTGRERLASRDVAVLAAREAAKHPVAAKRALKNLPKYVVGPEIVRFVLSTSRNLSITRRGP